MARVYVSIGSNVQRERSVRAAMSALQELFGTVDFSTVYESEAVGFDGENFYNLVAGFETARDVRTVVRLLREIEDRQGRDRSQPRFSSRTLDLDLLLYDDLVMAEEGVEIPREEITQNAFVLRPLAELAPGERHPVLGVTYAGLWEAFDHSCQNLWPVEFTL